jgi:hypothetical protein
VAGLGAAVWAGRGRHLSAQRLCAALVAWGIFAGLLVPALLGAAISVREPLDALTPRDDLRRGAALAAGALLVALVVALRRWPERRSDTLFLLLLGVPLSLGKLLYVHAVQMEPKSDFAGMWSMADAIARTGIVAPADWSQWLHLERVLPYLLPVRLLLGPELSSYGVANVVVGLASSLATYALGRRLFGRATARAAFAVSMIAPETWLACEIPTHEIPGALYAVLGLLVLYAAYDRVRAGRRSAILWGLGWGALVVVLNLQRSVGSWYLLACATVAAAGAVLDRPGRPWRRAAPLAVAALLLAPLLAFEAGRWSLRAAGLESPPGSFARENRLGLLAGMNSWSDGVPWHIAAEAARYQHLRLDWVRLGAAQLATETALTPGARAAAYVRHSRTLFALGSQTFMYVEPAALPRGRWGDVLFAAIPVAAGCFSVFFVLSLWRGCWRLARSPLPALSPLVPLAYLAVLAGVLILLGQVQPRYVYVIWYLGAPFAAHGLLPARAEEPGHRAGEVEVLRSG